MPPTVFEPAIPASERPFTHLLDRAATGTGTLKRVIGCLYISSGLNPDRQTDTALELRTFECSVWF